MPESTAGVDGERVTARPTSWAETYDVLRVRFLGTDAPRARTARRRRVVALEAGRIDRRPTARLRRFRIGGRRGACDVDGRPPQHRALHAGRSAVGAGWLMKAQHLAGDAPEGVDTGSSSSCRPPWPGSAATCRGPSSSSTRRRSSTPARRSKNSRRWRPICRACRWSRRATSREGWRCSTRR